MRNRVFIADLAIDENPAPHRITINLCDETQTAEDAIVVSETDQGSDARVTSIG